ncbi:MAG: hypothetical protein ACHQ3P_03875, partial [Candidatus Limnocylindrales bacterium]
SETDMKRIFAIVAPLALAIGLAACSSASAGQSAGPAGSATAPAAGTVRIVAKDVAFQAPSGTATAGSAFDIQFVNQDGFPHNVELIDAGGAKVFSGDTVSRGRGDVPRHGPRPGHVPRQVRRAPGHGPGAHRRVN